jgi:hypothetical protein
VVGDEITARGRRRFPGPLWITGVLSNFPDGSREGEAAGPHVHAAAGAARRSDGNNFSYRVMRISPQFVMAADTFCDVGIETLKDVSEPGHLVREIFEAND